MADTSKIYHIPRDLDSVKIGEAIVRYLIEVKEMVAEGTPTPEGYFLQAKSPESTWKKLAGMSKATQVQIVGGDNSITVSIGSGEWTDKIGAGVVGAVIFAPLMVTAAFGAFGQKKLIDDIFEFIEKYIYTKS